jgi:hypothetical protein
LFDFQKKEIHYCMAMLVSDMDVLATTKYKGIGLTTRQQATPMSVKQEVLPEHASMDHQAHP